MKKPYITVFTPVYNRGYCIKDVYDSLIRQTYTDFEWLVINDGSADNTETVVKECMEDGQLQIRYVYQTNGGQHRALNRAIELAKGKVMIIVDSDDDITDEALSRIHYYTESIQGLTNFAGVSGLRQYRGSGQVVGTPWPDVQKDYIDMSNIERYKYNMLLGDKAEAYLVDVLRKFYPIPAFDGENDVEKGWLWNRIAHAGLKVRWFNEAIYNCEYLADGMSKNIINNYKKNFNGYCVYIKDFITYDIGVLRKIKTIVFTCEIARSINVGIKELAKEIDVSTSRLACLYLVSYITPLRSKLRKRK